MLHLCFLCLKNRSRLFSEEQSANCLCFSSPSNYNHSKTFLKPFFQSPALNVTAGFAADQFNSEVAKAIAIDFIAILL